MTTRNVMREITPLTPADCFTIISKTKHKFDFPLHYHEEFELNLLLNARGAKRVVGENIEVIDDVELVLIGPDLQHGWFNGDCKNEDITEVTIQFHKDLINEKLLKKNQLSFLRDMLERSRSGIAFSPVAIGLIKERILALDKISGFASVLELLSLLHDLSISESMRRLSGTSFINEKASYHSRRIDRVFDHLYKNYHQQVTLAEVADLANMPEASFSRFIKQRTGRTFTDSLNEIRLGHASRMLIDSTKTVAEIAYHCGFNNVSNFNRIFKRKKCCIPSEYRKTYQSRLII